MGRDWQSVTCRPHTYACMYVCVYTGGVCSMWDVIGNESRMYVWMYVYRGSV